MTQFSESELTKVRPPLQEGTTFRNSPPLPWIKPFGWMWRNPRRQVML